MKQGNEGECQLAALVKQLLCKLILHFYVFDTLMEKITQLGSVFEFNVLYSIELIIPIFFQKITLTFPVENWYSIFSLQNQNVIKVNKC